MLLRIKYVIFLQIEINQPIIISSVTAYLLLFSLIVDWIKVLIFFFNFFLCLIFLLSFNGPKVGNRVIETFYFSIYIFLLENAIYCHNLNYHLYTYVYFIYSFSPDLVAKLKSRISNFLLCHVNSIVTLNSTCLREFVISKESNFCNSLFTQKIKKKGKL